MSKRAIIILAIVGGIILLIIVPFIGMYNGLVGKDEKAAESWAQVQNVYQRRADLVPQLVATVKGAADFEKSTLTEVVNARAAATSVTVDPANATPEQLKAFQATQDQLSSSLSRLLVTIERYPELKATKNFQDLQAQLAGTENRIAVERKKFNEAVQDYNKAIRVFPKNMVAGMFGFEKRAYFEATPGAEKAPEIEFNFD
ncbi:MAG: LemA family protein [Bacteroidales bacterium]|nr:LemA family protein [Bacteroidales bacterium]